jgi:hypothetical protein
MKKKYKVKVGDPFGGYATVGENLTLDEAKKLQKEVNIECDYFTTTKLEDENSKIIY